MARFLPALIVMVLIFGVRPAESLLILMLVLIGMWPGGVQNLWNRMTHSCACCPPAEAKDDRINM